MRRPLASTTEYTSWTHPRSIGVDVQAYPLAGTTMRRREPSPIAGQLGFPNSMVIHRAGVASDGRMISCVGAHANRHPVSTPARRRMRDRPDALPTSRDPQPIGARFQGGGLMCASSVEGW